jgi:hypothetical protein
MTNHLFLSALSGARQSSAGVRESGVRPSQYLSGVHPKFAASTGRNRAIKLFAPDSSTIGGEGVIATGTAFATQSVGCLPRFAKIHKTWRIEAADEREAIEKAAKKFEQDPAILIVIRRA